MKWYFAITESSLGFGDHDWPGLIRAAVNSARRNTTLEPYLLYDGEPNELTRDLQQRGVTIIPHRVSFHPALLAHAPSTRNPEGWIKVASGAFLRLDIPLIEQRDDLVLYTDCDVIFLCEPRLGGTAPPALFAAAPQSGTDYADMNSGVMLINVPAMRADHAALVGFATANLSLGLDQEILRAHYAGRYDPLDRTLNWKPYWGFNPNAQIVHFHGPKPVTARRVLHDPSHGTHANWERLLRVNEAGYRAYVRLWEDHADPERAVCTLDEVSRTRLRGWAIYRNDPTRRVELTAIIDGCEIGTILCDQPRRDVKAAGFGSDLVGFRYAVPPHGQRADWRLSFRDGGGAPVDLIVGGRRLTQCDIP